MGSEEEPIRYSHLWDRLRAENPEHSVRYAERWRRLAEQGMDVDGEARFVGALAAPGSSVLDAGCGQGRLGGFLSEHGYRVVGVDLDEYLISQARERYPRASWHVGDLAEFDHAAVVPQTPATAAEDGAPRRGEALAGFDAIVSAGNVLTFLDPAARLPALAGLCAALAPEGRIAIGFGAGRGYAFADFERDLAQAGLSVQQRFSTWNLHPFSPASEFLVCIAGRA